MVMTSSPSLLLTLQVTVRFTRGITVILWVALPLLYELFTLKQSEQRARKLEGLEIA